MVLFDEGLESLISQTTLNFHTHSDLSSLSRISTSLSTLRSARALRLDSQRAQLGGLTRRVRTAEQAHADALDNHDASGHAQEILALDTEKFRVAKGVMELRSECERREGEVRALRRTVEVLDNEAREGVEGRQGAQQEDGEVLKLRLYRSLGIEAQEGEGGKFRRVVVRNQAKGDVSVVNVEEGLTRGFYAGHIWGHLG